jgi:4-hydroxymandelate oxidase
MDARMHGPAGMAAARRQLLLSASAFAGMSLLPRWAGAARAAPDTPAGAGPLGEALNLADMERLAQARLEHMVYEFIASGAADEISLRWNREALDRMRLRPRVLVDVSRLNTSVTLFGQELPHPILLAPTAYHRLIHPEGELATARGASAAAATYVVSSYTTTPIEDIARAATQPLWFQLYIESDRGFTRDLVQRVEAAGCKALCLTVDTAATGIRNRQARAGFKLPPHVKVPYSYDVNTGRRTLLAQKRENPTWKDVEWLRSFVKVPLLLKGILNPADAEQAVRAGASGLIVSNHGGRSLDTVPATIEALPGVVDTVAGRLTVLMDGGIRRGTDVVKALASGAQAVLIGRPYCYGLGAAGAEGVQRVIAILRTELESAMALTGRPTLASIDRSVLWPEGK